MNVARFYIDIDNMISYIMIFCIFLHGVLEVETMIQEIVGQVPLHPCMLQGQMDGKGCIEHQGVRTGCHIRQWI